METRTSPQKRHSGKKRARGTSRRIWLLGLACLAFSPLSALGAGNESLGEYAVKATYLFNFTKFTDWPASAFAATNAPIVIGIVGEDPFGKIMDDIVRDEVVQNRKLSIKRLRADDDLQACHVLFISRSEKDRLQTLTSKVKGHPVLLIGDMNDFTQKGGMVSLILTNDKVKFEVNQNAAERADLKISSKLLKLASRIVNN